MVDDSDSDDDDEDDDEDEDEDEEVEDLNDDSEWRHLTHFSTCETLYETFHLYSVELKCNT